MADIKWIKLSVNMFDDEKIKLIRTLPDGDKIVMIWVQMMCLAGKINDGGSVYMGQNLAYSDEMLATIFNQPLNVVRAALTTLDNFEMIDVSSDGVIDIVNWEKHQNIDGMERIQQQNRERKRRFDLRKKVRELGYNPNDKEVPSDVEELEEYVKEISNVTVTSGNAIEEDKKRTEEDKKRINNKTDSKLSEKQLNDDFNELWKLYPNKKSKQKAFTSYKTAIKDGVTNDEIRKGIESYNKEIQFKRTETQYIAHGSTWFSQRRWEDDYEIGAKVLNATFAEEAPVDPNEVEVPEGNAELWEQYLKEQEANK